MNTKQLSATLLVVLLTDLMVNGDMIPVDTVLEVERGLRNDWKGSGLCRDATDEEIAEYRVEEGAAELIGEDIQTMAKARGDLEDVIYSLEQKHEQLVDQVEQLQGKATGLDQQCTDLQAELETIGKQHTTAQAELAELANQKKALAEEVAALEKAKKAASK